VSLTAAFGVRATADPQVTLRVLNLFAVRELTPDLLRVRRQGDELFLHIEQAGVDEVTATYIAEKLRTLIPVSHVDVEFRLGRMAA
jgi:hypothetical protein